MSTQPIDFKSQYLDWIKGHIEQRKINDNTYALALPFLDRHNDFIEVYIQMLGNVVRVTDDGAIINDLEMSGFELGSGKRKALFNRIVASYGVSFDDKSKSLFVECQNSDLPMKKHMLMQCMQKVDDLFYLAKSNVKSVFLEDVQSYLDFNDVRYTESPSFTGKSLLMTRFDFVIPKSKKAPERMVQVVNNLSLSYAKNILFGWNDIAVTRKDDSRLLAFIRDERTVPQKALTALQQYNVTPILWSDIDNYKDVLVA